MKLTSRSKLLMVFGVFVVPVVAAYLAYFGWRPAGHTNYGELLKAAPLQQTPANRTAILMAYLTSLMASGTILPLCGIRVLARSGCT